MNTNTKEKIFTLYTCIAKYFFIFAVIFIFLFGIIGLLILPDERDKITSNCQNYISEWTQILENGEKIPVTIPGKIPAESGEIITITTTLPNELTDSTYMCFRLIWQDAEIYVGDELRQIYNTTNSRFFGTNSPTKYVFVKLHKTDANKDLTLKFCSYSKYSGNLHDVYIGDMLSIWIYIIGHCGSKTIVALFLLLLSVFCILVCIILKFVYKRTLPLTYLACTLFFSALWMLSEIDFRQLIVSNLSILTCYAYWSLMLIPISLTLYINEIQNNYYKKVYFIPIVYSVLIFVIGTLFQFLDIFQFVQFLPYIHIAIIASIICIIVTITIDTYNKRIFDYLAVGIGIYGMLFASIVEIILYYISAILSLGAALAVGLLFLLIMAIIKTSQDVFQTEKKKQQAILAREAQAKFLANMSHEIRTPINAIVGMNEMILRESDDEIIKDYAKNIQSASKMLLGLVNDVLDFSKIESGHLELVENTYSLPALLNDELLLLNTRIDEKPISTNVYVSPELPIKLYGDELRIKQILTNLLSNAVKYTHKGNVTLKVYCNHLTDDTILLFFSVTDTGIGIKKENLSQLFNSFKRLELQKNRNIQGTGLGLNIAQQLAILMGGNISVESEYGKGSTFTLSIPQKIIDREPIGELQTALNKSNNNTSQSEALFTAPDANILITDDNSMNLTLMKGLLKRTKMNVDTASGGYECLELTRNKKYDLIFMDHMMPELDGLETFNILKSESANPNQNTAVIVMTANAIAGCREKYLEHGFDDYFSKPIEPNKLDALIIKYLPSELIHKGSSVPAADVVISDTDLPKVPTDTTCYDDEIPAELLEINQELGLSYCLNMENLYKEVLKKFHNQFSSGVPQLNDYVKIKDWKNYAILAHGMKGAALNIGATNFSELSLKHELAGKEENADFILSNYEFYLKVIKALLDKIETLL